MRMIARLGLITMCGAISFPAWADNDLNSLLSQLTFGGSQLVDETDDLDASDAADEVIPEPSDSVLEPADSMIESFDPPSLPAEVEGFTDSIIQESPEFALPIESVPPSSSAVPENRLDDLERSPMVFPGGLQPVPLPDASVQSQPNPHLPASSSIQSVPPVPYVSASPPPGHAASIDARRLASEPYHGNSALCDCYECRAHVAPTLPPPSTFNQYFQSRNSSSNLWAGYPQEAQRRSDHYLRHVRGECDCFKEKQHHFHWPVLHKAKAAEVCDSCSGDVCSCRRH